jgi:uncharacterized membrane protein
MAAGWRAGDGAGLLALPPDLILAYLALAVTLLLGLVLLVAVDRWRKRVSQAPPTGDQLDYLQELYDKGEISQEELDRLRTRLGPPPPPAGGPP